MLCICYFLKLYIYEIAMVEKSQTEDEYITMAIPCDL